MNNLFLQNLQKQQIQQQPIQKPTQILFDLLNYKVISLRWANKLTQNQINKIKAAILSCSNYTIPCITEDTEHPTFIIQAELASTRLMYNENNQITDIYGYFRTKDEISGNIIKFIVLIDNETNNITLSLDK